VTGSVDSGSFAMRFTFVHAAAASYPPQTPKKKGVLGSYGVAEKGAYRIEKIESRAKLYTPGIAELP
jgi:hypothetical protein